MGLIPEHIIDQVRQSIAIEEVIGRHVELKRAGSSFKALCPFHDEKSPSFHVNAERQTFKCFGCGKGGNVFTFLVELLGLSFPEAVRALADERGIQVPDTRGGPAPGVSRDHRRTLYDVLAFAQRMFRKALQSDEGAAARTYLAGRGYDDAAIGRFGLGFAPPGWDRLVKAAAHARIPVKALVDAGLAQPRSRGEGHYDRFRSRVMFPVRDLQGRVVTFGARALDPDDNPKYLNGPETDVFSKSGELFALDMARGSVRETREILLMEGYTDVLMAHLHGFDRAVAGMGTALTDRQATLMGRFADRVVMVYDSDDAGRAAAERGVEILLRAGLEVRIAHLPPGRDTDEILMEDGAQAFQAVIDGAQELFTFKIETLTARHDLDTPRGRAQAIEALIPVVACVKSALERDQLFRQIAERLGGGETEALLRREVVDHLRRDQRRHVAPNRAAAPAPQRRRAPPGQGAHAASRGRDERRLILGVLDERFRDAIFRAVGPEDFTDPVLRRIYEKLLDLEDQGRAYDLHTLIDQSREDAEAASHLADLPEDDDDLEESLERQLQHLESARRRSRERSELQALAERFRTAKTPITPAERGQPLQGEEQYRPDQVQPDQDSEGNADASDGVDPSPFLADGGWDPTDPEMPEACEPEPPDPVEPAE